MGNNEIDWQWYIGNGIFALLLGIAAYLLFVGLSLKWQTQRAQREQAARLAFRIAIREGKPRQEAMREYKAVKREWRKRDQLELRR